MLKRTGGRRVCHRAALGQLAVAFVALQVAYPGRVLAGPSQERIDQLVTAALAQIGVTLYYDSAYTAIPYPNGDVPIERGVCTDVIIRAYRKIGIDLQVEVHNDMKANFSAYPKLWGLSHPDPNIDHRRVPNLAVFFRRKGQALPVSNDPTDYSPGDIVTWQLPTGVPHIGIVSNTIAADKRHQMIHNIGDGAQREDCLFAFKITGHYRYPKPEPN
ncbi:MAG TPA: DUF1287 domain-containing protein [Chthoniobacterales bacterium]